MRELSWGSKQFSISPVPRWPGEASNDSEADWSDGYVVTVNIEFFPHIVVLVDSSLELTDDGPENVDIFLNLWNSKPLDVYPVLSHFTAGIFYC